MTEEKETTVLNTSVGADAGQPNQNLCDDSLADSLEEYNRYFRQLNDPSYLATVSMRELYETAYESKPPLIDGLLYPGTYLLVGAPKLGKSFLVAQLAYHVSTGTPLWNYPVRQGTVLYLALEDGVCRAGCIRCSIWKSRISSILQHERDNSEKDWTSSWSVLSASTRIPGSLSSTRCKRFVRSAARRTATQATTISLPG